VRRACKKDANHDHLVSAHRQLGWAVLDTYQVAQYIPGFTDAVGCHPYSGIIVFLEFKSEKGKLTKDEQAFHAAWPGPKEIERTVTDVMATHKKYMVSDGR